MTEKEEQLAYQEIHSNITSAIEQLMDLLTERDGVTKEQALEKAVGHIEFYCDECLESPDFYLTTS